MHRCTAGALICTAGIDIAAAGAGLSAIRSRLQADRRGRGTLAVKVGPHGRPGVSRICASLRK
jgi:hypothetical protein